MYLSITEVFKLIVVENCYTVEKFTDLPCISPQAGNPTHKSIECVTENIKKNPEKLSLGCRNPDINHMVMVYAVLNCNIGR